MIKQHVVAFGFVGHLQVRERTRFRTLRSRGHSGEKREANCGVSCS
jgi:hypothetical protein